MDVRTTVTAATGAATTAAGTMSILEILHLGIGIAASLIGIVASLVALRWRYEERKRKRRREWD